MKQYDKATVGKKGERIAAKFLRRQGYRILARNKHYGKNELDLIAKNKDFLVFVEVKTRSFTEGEQFTRPAEAVDLAKRRRTAEAARAHLREHPTARCPRFDVIEVYLARKRRLPVMRINHIPDAFSVGGHVRH